MHIDTITKAVAAAVLGLAVASPVTAGAQSRDDGAGTFAGIYIYSALKNGQPLAFCNHDIDYETLYPENAIDPINFECRILGPHKRGSYQRATVIPSVIRVGMYAMHPIEMSSGAFQQQDPFVFFLIVPLAFRRHMALGNDALHQQPAV